MIRSLMTRRGDYTLNYKNFNLKSKKYNVFCKIINNFFLVPVQKSKKN